MKTPTRIILGGVLGCVVLLTTGGSAFAQATDPLSVYQAHATATNAGDVEARVALYSPTAVLRLRIGTLTGIAQIRKWIESSTKDEDRVEIIGPSKVEGDTLTTVLRQRSSPFTKAGIDYVDLNQVIVVQGGKIQSVVATPTADSLPKLAKLAATPPASAAPASMPNTGQGAAQADTGGLRGGLWVGIAVLLIGGGLGVVLVRTRRRARSG